MRKHLTSALMAGLLAVAPVTLIALSPVNAADPVQLENEVPVPPPVVSAPDGIGIWGAIAYSGTDGKYGMFWGGNTRSEAEANALQHCQNANGMACELVQTFRNHRKWNDDDGLFPYDNCAALAVDKQSKAFGVASAKALSQARASALDQCNGTCKIVEQGCT
uniref:DUF4189 domain-containing protein n=1 Tax=Ochrobactrum sp. LM19 TaxID=1449781 RepID=A0A0D5A0S8_9HYPH|nr:DUF4189 domain-containing protein [Ochrobactrum sp. LM19]AJW30014.1 hypothetical protein pLM19O2_p69 [Ochrobactrum sp. LM19]